MFARSPSASHLPASSSTTSLKPNLGLNVHINGQPLHGSFSASASASASAPPTAALPAQPHANADGRADGDVPALLVPTDRGLEEFEELWLEKLGRLRVEREVVISGYALYALRTWYLSREKWSQSILTQTGKQTDQVSVYRLVAEPSLSAHEAEEEVARATRQLVIATKSTVRKTEWGSLLVTTPSAWGQDAFFVPGGDLREARPYLVVNTGLRRLGCGGRAAMTLEVPIPALRRKFLESYRLPVPPQPPALSRTTSPQTSPSKPATITTSPGTPRTPTHPVLTDPLCLMVLEVVRLIQASLCLWGLFQAERVDGLFCDETKHAISLWRRSMGMEHEESLKIEKETSGGCIDPRTLAVLLSSVTSSYYQLVILGAEKLPKNPFLKIERFLNIWQGYHANNHPGLKSDYLTVSSIRALTNDFHSMRSRSTTDPLKVHRFLFSGVAAATSNLSANLKGGYIDDTPLRKREHHSPIRAQPIGTEREREHHDSSKGLILILPDEEVTAVACPNVLTSNLESYISGVLKTREKDLDTMGARRIGWLWSGRLGASEDTTGPHRKGGRGAMRRRTFSKDFKMGQGADDEDSSPTGGSGRGPLHGVVKRTGSMLVGGLGGLVPRRGMTYDTSDSEGGPGPSSRAFGRRKQSLPLVVEPQAEEFADVSGRRGSLSPSQTVPSFDSRVPTSLPRGASYLSAVSAASRVGSMRPSIITALSPSESTASLALPYPAQMLVADREARYLQEPWDERQSSRSLPSRVRGTAGDRALAWRDSGRQTAMLRTASDGADVTVEEGGNEWEVLNPHGTGKGRDGVQSHELRRGVDARRRHSLEDREQYKGMRVTAAENLSVDVELCYAVQRLREQERELAQKAAELKHFEASIQAATEYISRELSNRRSHLSQIQAESQHLTSKLSSFPDEIEHDPRIRDAINGIEYDTTGDTRAGDLQYRLERLEERWEEAHRGNVARRRVADVHEGAKGGWWPW